MFCPKCPTPLPPVAQAPKACKGNGNKTRKCSASINGFYTHCTACSAAANRCEQCGDKCQPAKVKPTSKRNAGKQ